MTSTTSTLQDELKTPTELIEHFGEACEYNAREIGYLLMLGLVDGVKIRYGCLITVSSFNRLLEYKKINGRSKYNLGK